MGRPIAVACALLVVASLPLVGPRAEVSPSPEQVRATQTALALILRDDSFRAIEYITSTGDHEEAMQLFSLVTRDLYWDKKDLTATMAIGRAGVQWGLAEATRLAHDNPELAGKLRARAREIAYDLASFSWPGWQEQGIEISRSNLTFGQDAARTNLRLAMELKMGDLPMSRAYWILGVHHLAVARLDGARKAFVEGIKFATAAEATEFELLLRGYVYLVDLLAEPDNDDLATELEFVKSRLARSPEGRFFKEQLENSCELYLSQSEPAEDAK